MIFLWVQLIFLVSLSIAQPNLPHSSLGTGDGEQVFHVYNDGEYLGPSYGQTDYKNKFMEPVNLDLVQQALPDALEEVREVLYADSFQPALDAHAEGTETATFDAAVAKGFAEDNLHKDAFWGQPWSNNEISEFCPAPYLLEAMRTHNKGVKNARNMGPETRTPSQQVYHQKSENTGHAGDAEKVFTPVSNAHSHVSYQAHTTSDGSQSAQPGSVNSIMHAIASTSTAVNSGTSQEKRKNSAKRKRIEYICPVASCGKIYFRSYHLKGHMFSHTGEKPHQCSFNGCNRKFKRSDELTRHFRVHSGERSHICHECNKTFGRTDHLQEHFKSETHRLIKTISSGTTIKCSWSGCDRTFKRFVDLSK